MSSKFLMAFLVFSLVFGAISFAGSNSKKRDVSELIISEQELDPILEKYLTKYINLAINYHRGFFPYYLILPNNSDMPKLIYRDWCKESKVSFSSEFKKKIKLKIHKIWEKKQIFFDRVNPVEDLGRSLKSIGKRVESLRKKFLFFKKQYDGRLLSLLRHNIQSLDEFNSELQKIGEESVSNIEHYRRQYLHLTSYHPYEILRTKYMIDLVEGNQFEVEAVDLYNAVRELKDTYKKNFIFEISSASIKTYDSNKSLSFNLLHGKSLTNFEKSRIPSEGNFMPPLDDEDLFRLLINFNKNDPGLAKLIAQKQLQKALWSLRSKGFRSEAAELESLVYNKFMHPEAIIWINSLGGGVSKSFKVQFKSNILGVYKPKAVLNFRQGNANLLAYIAGGYKNEIAAFHMDRLLDLNMVPMTKLVVPHGGKKGSLQFYIKNTYNARDLSSVNPRFPIKNRKLSKGKGRSHLTRDINLFDWIIDNVDRNLDNYLIQFDGQFILIDHGFSFVTPLYFQPREQQIQKMLPSIRLANRIIYLKKNPHLVPQAISHLVGKDVAYAVQKRLDFMGKYLETYTQSNPCHKKAVKSSFCS